MAFQNRQPGLDLYGIYQSFREGQDSARKNRLLDLDEQGRALQGQVLAGDKSKLPMLMQVDAQRGMQTKQFTDEQQKAETQEFLQAAYGATTPQKWAQVVQRFRAKGHEFDPGEDAWENRENLLNEGMTIAEQRGWNFKLDEATRAQSNADRAFGLDQQQFNETKRYHNEQIALDRDKVTAASAPKASPGYRYNDKGTMEFVPGGPADPAVIASKKGSPQMTASMLKLRRETENNIVGLKNTKALLTRALELAPNTFEGFGARARAAVGTKAPFLPGVGMVADPAGAMATTEYGNIMDLGAIETMAETLKGASTDFELKEFKGILSDPSVPASIKQATIKKMMKRADSQLNLEEQRLEEFKGSGGTDNEDGSSLGEWTPEQQDILRQADEAISAGANPQDVLKRLHEDHGLDVEIGGQ